MLAVVTIPQSGEASLIRSALLLKDVIESNSAGAQYSHTPKWTNLPNATWRSDFNQMPRLRKLNSLIVIL